MKRYLLLGAGFSRNWGAPLGAEMFGYLLALPAIGDHPRLRALLLKHQSAGGFEQALAELQAKSDTQSQEDRRELEKALQLLFDRINRRIFDRPEGLEFQQHKEWMVREFLGRFDAIFTLNQDLLLEHHYVRHVPLLQSPRGWNGAALPYMRRVQPIGDAIDRTWAMHVWAPEEDPRAIDRHAQPIYKLHGSSNWRTSSAESFMVLGGAKESAIQRHDVLARYFREFRAVLRASDSRLCIVGYGFGDPHINNELEHAMHHSELKIFLVDTAGIDAYRRVNRSHGAPIRAASGLEQAFNVGLRGVSSRSLSEIFGGSNLDHTLLMGFVDPRQ